MSVQLEVTLCDTDGELGRRRLVIGVAWARQSAPLHFFMSAENRLMRALHGALGCGGSSREMCRPFRALCFRFTREPMALPWAGDIAPLRGFAFRLTPKPWRCHGLEILHPFGASHFGSPRTDRVAMSWGNCVLSGLRIPAHQKPMVLPWTGDKSPRCSLPARSHETLASPCLP